MLSILAKTMLTFSALAPVAATYAWVAYTQQQSTVAIAAALAAFVAVVFCWLVLRAAHNDLEPTDFTVQTAEAADGENLGFMLLYLLPLFTDKIKDLDWQLWLPTLAFLGVMIANGYAHHFNPLLGLLGWHFYKVSGAGGVSYILVTKRKLAETLTPMRVAKLTDYMLIETRGDK